MTEQQTVTAQTTENQSANPFSEESWIHQPITQEEKPIEQKPEEKKPIEQASPVINEELKTQLGFEKWEDAKAEIENLRKIKDTPATPQAIKYANEESEKLAKALQDGKLDEAYSYLDTQRKINKLTTGDITKDTAADIVKADMRFKYKDLSDSEIDYKFNKRFSVPSKPVQSSDELDEDFSAREKGWLDQVKDVETELLIEAKLARPELEKFKKELVLPSPIASTQAEAAPTQEELDKAKKFSEEYLLKVIEEIKGFNGFNAVFKDEEVEIPVSFALSQEQKNAVESKMKLFAENNFNANAILAQRWVKEGGELNIQQIVNDLARLEIGDSANQKMVNDAVGQRLTHQIKKDKNISLNGNGQGGTFTPQGEKPDADKMAEVFFSQ